MNEISMLGLAGVAGVLLGAVFFGGLWWTVRKGVSFKRPALSFLGSLLFRTGVVVAGFYLVSDGHWQRLLACLFGFAIARFIVTWVTRPPIASPTARRAEARHAP